MVSLPEFVAWGGGPVKTRWSLGWWTGPEGDLLCVIPKVRSHCLAELALSPACSNRLLALISFLLKIALFAIDDNLATARKFDYDTPNTESHSWTECPGQICSCDVLPRPHGHFCHDCRVPSPCCIAYVHDDVRLVHTHTSRQL